MRKKNKYFNMNSMESLPSSWEVKPFGDVFDYVKTTSFSRNKLSDEVTENKVKYIHYGDIHKKFKLRVLDVSNEKIPFLKDEFVNFERFSFLKDGDLVIADASEDYDGVAECTELNNIGESKIIGGLHTIVARDKGNLTCGGFRVYIFKNKAVSNELKMIATGLSVLGISKGNLSKLPIPLPPLSEQKKIATVLSTIQQAREKTEAVIEAARQVKQSMMKHLFTYGPVPVSEVDQVELKETEIGDINSDWDVTELGKLGKFQYGYTESATLKKIGPKFLRITDIDLGSGAIKWSLVPYCKISDKNFEKYSLKRGDLLFARIGATTGKSCIIRNDKIKSVFASYLIRFSTHDRQILPEFLFYLTQTDIYWDQIIANKGGKLKGGISSTLLKKFQIPLPSINDQSRIVEFLYKTDQKIEAEITHKEALETLFKSMLEQLMTGKVRVADLDIDVLEDATEHQTAE